MPNLERGSVCLLQINDQRGAFAILSHLAQSAPGFVAFADPNSEGWHDMFDAACAKHGNIDIPTTWHDEESLEDIVEQFVDVYMPFYSENCRSTVIEVGTGTLIETVEKINSEK